MFLPESPRRWPHIIVPPPHSITITVTAGGQVNFGRNWRVCGPVRDPTLPGLVRPLVVTPSFVTRSWGAIVTGAYWNGTLVVVRYTFGVSAVLPWCGEVYFRPAD